MRDVFARSDRFTNRLLASRAMSQTNDVRSARRPSRATGVIDGETGTEDSDGLLQPRGFWSSASNERSLRPDRH